MLESIFGHGPAQSAPAAAVVHDVVQVRLLGLMVVDTFRWKHAWAAWRIRFAIDNDVRDMAYAQITAFVRDQVVPHCTQRAECADIVLYLADLRDARTVIRLHGHTTQGPGLISSLQGSASYEQATAFAGELAAELRNGGIGEDAGLPDLHWTVTGAGLTRVATTKVDSLTVVVRIGAGSHQGMWLVAVNDRAVCAQFRSRGDAMSKMGVGAALATYGVGPSPGAAARARV
jgi:hypothetical protein